MKMVRSFIAAMLALGLLAAAQLADAAEAKLQISEPQAVQGGDVFAMLKLRDPNKLVERLASWAQIVQPSLNAEALRNQINGMLGVDLKELRAGEAVTTVLLAPADAQGKPTAVTLMPIAENSPSVQGLTQRMPNAKTEAVGQYTALSAEGSTETLARAKKMDQALIGLEKAPAPTDIQAYANIAAVMQKYGAMLQQQVQGLQMLMAMAAAQQNQGADAQKMAQVQQILQAEVQAGLDALNQLQYLNAGVEVGDERLELSLTARGKAGSGLEKGLQHPPFAGQDLTPYVAEDAIARVQQNFYDMKGFIDLYMKYAGPVISGGDTAALEKFKADMGEFSKFGPMQMATAFNISPKGKLVYEVVAKCEDNKAYMELVRKKFMEWMNSGLVHDFYAKMGINISVQEDPKTRTVAGAEVHRYNLKVEATGKMTEKEKEQLQKMAGELVVELAAIKDVVVITVGEPIDAVAGRLTGTAGEPIAARKAFPDGGVMYGDVNVARIVQLMKENAPQGKGEQIPTLSPDTPEIIFVGYHTGGVAYYRLGVPKGLVSSVKKAVDAQQGAGSGAANQQ